MPMNENPGVADPHPLDAYPDPACHSDVDLNPACHFDADPDLLVTLMQMQIQIRIACHFDADANPGPDPTFQSDADLYGS
jgi:hypothetical protein